MRRIKAAIGAAAAVAAAVAGVGVAAAPAGASTAYCKDMGLNYRCQYGISSTTLGNGTTEVFVVGTDNAVWTNWNYTSGAWNGWVSMGGAALSKVTVVELTPNDPDNFAITVTGTDGSYWSRGRSDSGSWTPWEPTCLVYEASQCA